MPRDPRWARVIGCERLRPVPWSPELASAPLLERFLSQAADARAAAPVPYFARVRSGETDALVESFAGEPELHHPVRGRVKGRRAFERFVAETNAWLTAHNAVGGQVQRIITPRRVIEETLLTLDGEQGRMKLPIGIVADRDGDARIIELRVYYSGWPLSGRHSDRPPLLQPDPRQAFHESGTRSDQGIDQGVHGRDR
jgi:hypothetical protein